MTVFLPQIFKYRQYNDHAYPIITALIGKPTEIPKIKVLALVDSGASMSVFQPDIAQDLGIKIETGKPTELQGVGGKITGYIHNLTLQCAHKTIECPVVFSHQYKVSFNLLGRSGFFDSFLITFNELKKQISVL